MSDRRPADHGRCPACGGTGQQIVLDDPPRMRGCPACAGTGGPARAETILRDGWGHVIGCWPPGELAETVRDLLAAWRGAEEEAARLRREVGRLTGGSNALIKELREAEAERDAAKGRAEQSERERDVIIRAYIRHCSACDAPTRPPTPMPESWDVTVPLPRRPDQPVALRSESYPTEAEAFAAIRRAAGLDAAGAGAGGGEGPPA